MRFARLIWMVVASVSALGLTAHAQEGFEGPKPGAEHKVFDSEVGTWDAEIKMWTDPNGDPMISKGVEVNSYLPGGLWLLSEFKGEFGGAEFHGRGQTGYDTNKKKYIGTWIDSMTTGLMVSEGTYDAKTHTLTMIGDMFDQAQGKLVKTKSVTVIKPDGTRTMTLSVLADGAGADGIKMMEITYKKKK